MCLLWGTDCWGGTVSSVWYGLLGWDCVFCEVRTVGVGLSSVRYGLLGVGLCLLWGTDCWAGTVSSVWYKLKFFKCNLEKSKPLKDWNLVSVSQNWLLLGSESEKTFEICLKKFNLLTYLLIYLPSYLLTCLHTPCSRVLLEKLTVLQLVKKFPHFMEPEEQNRDRLQLINWESWNRLA
jgi:hypothetical protein